MTFFFTTLSEKNQTEYLSQVIDSFEKTIKPLYGNQDEAIRKIQHAFDRTCRLLVDGKEEKSTLAGILVYKNEPTNEFSYLGAENALEIKTLFITNQSAYGGQGLGSRLMHKVDKVAKDAKFNSIVVTVSSKVTQSLEFFQRKGFVTAQIIQDKYQVGASEHIMIKYVNKLA